MICPRCKNEDPDLFYTDAFGTYCRKCVNFTRININEKCCGQKLPTVRQVVRALLQYPLTHMQKTIAHQCIQSIKNNENIVIKACCGSGKTEMMIPVIEYCLNNQLTIGLAIPRRQVVLELTERFKKIFPSIKITPICEGHTRITDGHFIICTTHQLYRFHKSFDILIIDEVDAFPFANNDVLQEIAKNSYKRNTIYISATIDIPPYFKSITLYKRYHNRKLIVPYQFYIPMFLQYLYLLYYIEKMKHLTLMIFVPTIDFATKLHNYLNLLYPVFCITSQTENKDEILQNLKVASRKILITTTIMERGVTIADATVVVMYANHPVFTHASLIQIAGRVDRAIQSYGGSVVFLASKPNIEIKKCIKNIKEMNQ